MALKFFYNGIKGSDGKLQGATYSSGPYLTLPKGTITIYGKRYRDFSKEVYEAFAVENNTDIQTDYFENDKIRVNPGHPLYAAVAVALAAHEARNQARYARYVAKAA